MDSVLNEHAASSRFHVTCLHIVDAAKSNVKQSLAPLPGCVSSIVINSSEGEAGSAAESHLAEQLASVHSDVLIGTTGEESVCFFPPAVVLSKPLQNLAPPATDRRSRRPHSRTPCFQLALARVGTSAVALPRFTLLPPGDTVLGCCCLNPSAHSTRGLRRPRVC